jgi:hypothetical protein
MLKCWNIKASKRPSFKESIEFFEQELKKYSSLDSLTKTHTKLSLDSILIDTNTYEDLNITTTSNTNNSCSDDNIQLSILNNENINNIKMIDENLNDSNYESASSSYYSSSSVNNTNSINNEYSLNTSNNNKNNNNNNSVYNDNMKLLIDKTRKNSLKFIDTIKLSNNNSKLPILFSVDENFV